jgi:hypothetical protein
MKALALTTDQIRAGILIADETGPRFYTLPAVVVIVFIWALGVSARLIGDTAQAIGLVWQLVAANLAHHIDIFFMGCETLCLLFTPGFNGQV